MASLRPGPDDDPSRYPHLGVEPVPRLRSLAPCAAGDRRRENRPRPALRLARDHGQAPLWQVAGGGRHRRQAAASAAGAGGYRRPLHGRDGGPVRRHGLVAQGAVRPDDRGDGSVAPLRVVGSRVDWDIAAHSLVGFMISPVVILSGSYPTQPAWRAVGAGFSGWSAWRRTRMQPASSMAKASSSRMPCRSCA